LEEVQEEEFVESEREKFVRHYEVYGVVIGVLYACG